MHFCRKDYPGARKLFTQALSMDTDNYLARFMIYLIDWLAGSAAESFCRQQLLALDWRSPFEFFGHLVRILEGRVDEKTAVKGGYSSDEKGWLYYTVGLMYARREDLKGTENSLRKSVQEVDSTEWVFFLALSRLEQVWLEPEVTRS